MKRILLVDHDPRALESMRLALHAEPAWEVRLAVGAQAGLVAIANETLDAVVTAMVMPGTDGTAVLEAARCQQPGAIRLILSEPRDIVASARAMHVAHQFLAKPCPDVVLVEALRRGLRVQEQLVSEDLLQIVCGVTTLPSPPRVFQVLTAALADPSVDMGLVVQTVRAEVGLCAKVMQLVNSSCLGVGRQLTDLREAVTYLGLRTLKQLVLGAEVFSGIETARLAPECNFGEEQEHAVTIARIAAEIVAPDPLLGDAAFTAALLHDIGELVLAGHMPATYRRTKDVVRARRCGAPMTPGDANLLDLHARVGGYLAGIWGLPDVVVEAVWHHHRPSRLPDPRLHLAGIVHVADCLHHYLRTGGDEERTRVLDRMLDREWLEAAGCADQLEGWCERTLALGNELVAAG